MLGAFARRFIEPFILLRRKPCSVTDFAGGFIWCGKIRYEGNPAVTMGCLKHMPTLRFHDEACCALVALPRPSFYPFAMLRARCGTLEPALALFLIQAYRRKTGVGELGS